MISINSDGIVYGRSAQPVKHVLQAVYLGGLLHSGAASRPETTSRLGEARQVFKSLATCWNHTGISKSRKLRLFNVIVPPKLLYNLESL